MYVFFEAAFRLSIRKWKNYSENTIQPTHSWTIPIEHIEYTDIRVYGAQFV